MVSRVRATAEGAAVNLLHVARVCRVTSLGALLAVAGGGGRLLSIDSDCAQCGEAITIVMRGDRILAARPAFLALVKRSEAQVLACPP